MHPRNRYYTGIGSRETPKDIMDHMENLARQLGDAGWMVRSGGAQGADTAFEMGAPSGLRRIYLPWESFSNGRNREDCVVPSKAFSKEIIQQATDIASRFHPYWHGLKPGPRQLMIRNVFQVLGDDLQTPSRFVWCWAPNPKVNSQNKLTDVDGGTGMAVRLAASMNIPTYHFSKHWDAYVAYQEKKKLEGDTPPVLKQPRSIRL